MPRVLHRRKPPAHEHALRIDLVPRGTALGYSQSAISFVSRTQAIRSVRASNHCSQKYYAMTSTSRVIDARSIEALLLGIDNHELDHMGLGKNVDESYPHL